MSLVIRHVTTYPCTWPVKSGMPRRMFRPPDSHDFRLLGATPPISPPAPSEVSVTAASQAP